MKKFALLGMVLVLSACNEVPSGSTTAKLDASSTLHNVCLDGVEYWFREGNNAVLAPRLKVGNIGTQPHVVPCSITPTETNDAAVIGVVSQM